VIILHKNNLGEWKTAKISRKKQFGTAVNSNFFRDLNSKP